MLNSKWLSVKPKDESTEEFEKGVRAGNYILRLLTEIIKKELATTEASRLDDYDNPNWPYRRADRDGMARAYRSILLLTDLKGAD